MPLLSLHCKIALHIAIFDQGHPISFRTLGAGVKINRFPNTVRWNDNKNFMRTAAKFQILCWWLSFRRQYAGKTDSAPTTMRCRRSLAKRFSTSFQRFFCWHCSNLSQLSQTYHLPEDERILKWKMKKEKVNITEHNRNHFMMTIYYVSFTTTITS